MAGSVWTEEQVQALRDALLRWFDRHKRDLPWRRSRDPYAIWVSEIMLQQTRVAAVLEHYARWMQRFPTLEALAAAEESEVLALWSGLGYYRRARFLHAGAKAVVADHGGKLPRSIIALRGLPGVGEYTAAAIASIAFDERVAVVDGNVERVVMRLAGLSLEQSPVALQEAVTTPAENLGAPQGLSSQAATARPQSRPSGELRSLAAAPLAREIRALANRLLSPERPGDANQAAMELGATVCLPRAPLCLHCPVHPWCATRGEHVTAARKTMQSRSIVYGLAQRERQGAPEVLLAQRPADTSLMPGMWELPEVDSAAGCVAPLLSLRHAITVTNYTVRIVPCTAQEILPANGTTKWVPVTQLAETALTGLARKALKRLALWPQPAASEMGQLEKSPAP